jgi:hypothetical protein
MWGSSLLQNIPWEGVVAEGRVCGKEDTGSVPLKLDPKNAACILDFGADRISQRQIGKMVTPCRTLLGQVIKPGDRSVFWACYMGVGVHFSEPLIHLADLMLL